jgi:hypothetical protein
MDESFYLLFCFKLMATTFTLNKKIVQVPVVLNLQSELGEEHGSSILELGVFRS